MLALHVAVSKKTHYRDEDMTSSVLDCLSIDDEEAVALGVVCVIMMGCAVLESQLLRVLPDYLQRLGF